MSNTTDARLRRRRPPPGGFSLGGLSDEQRAERIVDFDENEYGFVRLARDASRNASRDAGKSRSPESSAFWDVQDDPDDPSATLARLHVAAASGKRKGRNNALATALTNRLRDSPEFRDALARFVRREVCPALGVARVAYQRRPTVRVHLAGAPAMGYPHADGADPYNHQPGEVNVWVPLTKVWGGNSLTSESAPGAEDFHAFEARPGQFVRFDGNRCWHYTTANDTEATRVSFDLRVVPFHLFDDDHRGPKKKNGAEAVPLRLGQYYADSAEA